MPGKILNTPNLNFHPFELEQAGHPEYGGAAVIRMTLGSDKIKGATPQPIPSQAAMFGEAGGLNDTASEGTTLWNIDPGAMNAVLNDRDQRPGFSFAEFSYPDRASADLKIINTINDWDVGPAVLTGATRQWICAVGYETNDAGQLTAFRVHDPARGAGGVPFAKRNLVDWDLLFSRVSRGTRWNGKFVTVCDPLPDRAEIERAPRSVKRPGDRILSPDEAVELAREGIEEGALFGLPETEPSIEQASPQEARLVTWGTRRGDHYYLVSWATSDGRVPLMMTVDARYGDVRSVAALPDAPRMRIRTREEVLELVLRRPIPRHEPIAEVRDRILGGVDEWLGVLRGGLETTVARRRLHELIEGELLVARRPADEFVFLPELTQVSHELIWTPETQASLFSPFYRVSSGLYSVYVKAWLDDGDGEIAILDPDELLNARMGG